VPLAAGLTEKFAFVVPETKTVPHLYPEAPEFQTMPQVFATGFLVGLVEWTCMRLIQRELGPDARSVGTDVKLTHTAATPPGLTVTVEVRLESVRGPRLAFSAVAHDGVDEISSGTHERFLIDFERFVSKAEEKKARALRGG